MRLRDLQKGALVLPLSLEETVVVKHLQAAAEYRRSTMCQDPLAATMVALHAVTGTWRQHNAAALYGNLHHHTHG